jgi:hypothetical protein
MMMGAFWEETFIAGTYLSICGSDLALNFDFLLEYGMCKISGSHKIDLLGCVTFSFSVKMLISSWAETSCSFRLANVRSLMI